MSFVKTKPVTSIDTPSVTGITMFDFNIKQNIDYLLIFQDLLLEFKFVFTRMKDLSSSKRVYFMQLNFTN